LVAKDSTGKLVGYVFDVESVPTIVLNSAGILFRVAVTRDGFGSGIDDRLRFETPDCSGTAYLPASSGALISAVFLVPPDTTAYIPDPAASPRTIEQQSEFIDTCRVIPNAGSPPLQVPNEVPAIKIAVLGSYYTPPFSLVPQGCCGDCNEDGTVAINELVTAVNSALYGCPTP
jgi:hypothetical protein